jgi:hypothetical protein
MKINLQILSIPPYISTSWKNIASLHVEHEHSSLILIITLLSGARIEIPQLQTPIIEEIFAAHARFLEQDEKTSQPKAPPLAPMNLPIVSQQLLSLELPIKHGFANVESMGTLLQHNPELADSPDLPSEVLDKITQLSKSMGIDDPHAVPKPEPQCNCMRCQIARAMQAAIGDSGSDTKEEEEEIVSDEELTFKTWDVAQLDDKLYRVSNPLDGKEYYNVFLGDPVGCTCGENHCEHIHAVLKS